MTFERVPLKRLGSVFLGKMLQTAPKALTDLAAPYLRAAHVQPGGRLIEVDDKTMWFDANELSQHDLRVGDVVVVEGGAGYGRAAVITEARPGWGFQNSIVRVRPYGHLACGQFLAYALQSAQNAGEIEVACFTATIPHFTADKVGAFLMPAPPLDEQRAIADYLDRETARIDTLIEEQQRLIELLRERRQALIEIVVGQGVNPAASKKPSGLFWTAEVPKDWMVANIRKVAAMKTGHTPSRSKVEYWVEGECIIPWFTLADVWQLRDGRRTYLGETASRISQLGLAKSAAELLPSGTVVLSRTASVGFSGVMPVPMATSQDFWNWIPSDRLAAEYLMWTFRAMRSELESLMIGSTHKTIYQPTAAAFRIPVPPLDEQRQIATFLDDL